MPAERLALAIALALGAGAARAGDAPAAPPTAEDAELFEFLGEFADDGFVDPFALDDLDEELQAEKKAPERGARAPRRGADQSKKPAADAAETAPERRPEKDDG